MNTTSSDGCDHRSDETGRSLAFLEMVGSILASFFGVQSSKRRERDFALGKPLAFFMVGVLMTAAWYGAIALIVHFVVQ